MKKIYSGVAAAVLLCAVCGSGWARTEEETWDRCLQQDKLGPLEPDDIIEACRKVLKMDFVPPNVRNDAYNNIGVANIRMKKYSEAISAFTSALRFLRELPDVPEVRQLGNYTRANRAKAYVVVKQYDAALADYDLMASREPIPKYRAQRCLAHALFDNDFASALPDCQKAIEADKTIDYAYAGWFIVEYRQGKFADVKADCDLARQNTFLTMEGEYVCTLARIRLGDNTLRERLQKDALDLLEHGERFKELGMVP